MHVKRLAIVSASLFLAGIAFAAPAARKHTVFITPKLDVADAQTRGDVEKAIDRFHDVIHAIEWSKAPAAEFSYRRFWVKPDSPGLWSEFAGPAQGPEDVRWDCANCGVEDLFDNLVKETLFRRARLYVATPVKSCSVTPANEVTIAVAPQNLVGIEPQFHYAVRMKNSPSSIPGLILAPFKYNEVDDVTARYQAIGPNIEGFVDRCRAGNAGGYYLLMPYTRLPTGGNATNSGFNTAIWP